MTDENIFESPDAFHKAINEVSGGSEGDSTDNAPPAPQDDVDLPPLDDGNNGNDDIEPINDGQDNEDLRDESQSQDDPDNAEDDDDDYGADESGKIPLGRFKKAIQQKNELKDQYQQLREEFIVTQTELKNFKEALQIYNNQDGGNNENDVSAEYDPLDEAADKAYKKEIQALRKEIDDLKGSTTQNQKSVEAQAFSTTVAQQQAAFERDNPDFSDAFNHVAKLKYQEALRVTSDESRAAQYAQKSLAQIAEVFYKRGENVASAMYDLAKDYGYTKKQPAPKKGADIDKIKENIGKTSGIGSIASTTASPSYNPSAYMRPENVDKIRSGKGGMIDPKKFHKILKGLQNQG